MDVENEGPKGLGGWLILVIIGLVLSPFRIGLTVVTDLVPIFRDGTWEALTSPSSEVYDPLWRPLIGFEVVGNALLVALSIVALVFVLMKSRHAPRIVIAWFAFTLAFVAMDMWLVTQIPMIAAMPTDPDSVKELVRAILSAAIWIPYFLVSRRVRATFVEDWPRPARASA